MRLLTVQSIGPNRVGIKKAARAQSKACPERSASGAFSPSRNVSRSSAQSLAAKSLPCIETSRQRLQSLWASQRERSLEKPRPIRCSSGLRIQSLPKSLDPRGLMGAYRSLARPLVPGDDRLTALPISAQAECLRRFLGSKRYRPRRNLCPINGERWLRNGPRPVYARLLDGYAVRPIRLRAD